MEWSGCDVGFGRATGVLAHVATKRLCRRLASAAQALIHGFGFLFILF